MGVHPWAPLLFIEKAFPMHALNLAYIDFESRSIVDIKRSGADVYARHPLTDILCMVYAFNENTPVLIRQNECEAFEMFHGELFDHVSNGGKVVAHNAAFEYLIWNNVGVKKYGWPILKREQLICTMAMSYAMSLPGALEKAAAAVGLTHQKDMQGHRVMLQLSQPKDFDSNGNPIWRDDAQKFEKLYNYCLKDVEAERDLYKRIMQLSPDEKDLWLLDQKINERGVYVDVSTVKAAIKLVTAEKTRLDQRMREVTNNEVGTCTAASQLTHFLSSKGIEVKSVDKSSVIELLNKDDLPSDVREALLLRQEAAKSSTAKLEAMLESVCDDGRMRGLFQYHGAGATGRWAGRRVQLQNLPRPKLSQVDIDGVFNILEGINYEENIADCN